MSKRTPETSPRKPRVTPRSKPEAVPKVKTVLSAQKITPEEILHQLRSGQPIDSTGWKGNTVEIVNGQIFIKKRVGCVTRAVVNGEPLRPALPMPTSSNPEPLSDDELAVIKGIEAEAEAPADVPVATDNPQSAPSAPVAETPAAALPETPKAPQMTHAESTASDLSGWNKILDNHRKKPFTICFSHRKQVGSHICEGDNTHGFNSEEELVAFLNELAENGRLTALADIRTNNESDRPSRHAAMKILEQHVDSARTEFVLQTIALYGFDKNARLRAVSKLHGLGMKKPLQSLVDYDMPEGYWDTDVIKAAQDALEAMDKPATPAVEPVAAKPATPPPPPVRNGNGGSQAVAPAVTPIPTLDDDDLVAVPTDDCPAPGISSTPTPTLGTPAVKAEPRVEVPFLEQETKALKVDDVQAAELARIEALRGKVGTLEERFGLLNKQAQALLKGEPAASGTDIPTIITFFNDLKTEITDLLNSLLMDANSNKGLIGRLKKLEGEIKGVVLSLNQKQRNGVEAEFYDRKADSEVAQAPVRVPFYVRRYKDLLLAASVLIAAGIVGTRTCAKPDSPKSNEQKLSAPAIPPEETTTTDELIKQADELIKETGELRKESDELIKEIEENPIIPVPAPSKERMEEVWNQYVKSTIETPPPPTPATVAFDCEINKDTQVKCSNEQYADPTEAFQWTGEYDKETGTAPAQITLGTPDGKTFTATVNVAPQTEETLSGAQFVEAVEAE